MVPYYLLAALPFLLSVIQFQSRAKMITEKSKNYPLVLFFVLYFFLLAFRDITVGADTGAYETVFLNVSNTAWKDLYEYKSSEVGYSVLNKLVSWLGGDYRAFLIVSSGIIVAPHIKLYYDYSDNSMVSLSLFMVLPIYLMYFSGVRQSLAMAMGILAFYATRDKKPLRFLLFVLLAVSFHLSGIILLAMYPLYHLRMRLVHLFVLIPAFLVAYPFRSRIFTALLPLMGEKYAERYSELEDTGAVTMLLLFLIFMLYAFLVPDEEDLDDVTRGMRNFLVLTVFVQMFSTISIITMRMNYYYLIFLPLVVPRITHRWKKVDSFFQTSINVVMVVFFLVYYFQKAYDVDSLNIYPYIPFWQGGVIQ